ncbi:cell wall metabolism sensor histidine kinase WalK [Bacillus sp. EB600]|uniref:sensor histidine kinase n=1 Tax=Bacillus sp. EB600 TaxID=2806345 RepID=UPI00210BDA36|nr:HAMP domain-containing sensor histidine kinase [Bacillus sp. EB600]MCQ6280544.1 HAMP domain-containing histidine kinase [Bacillus sp. EB600]
MFRKTKLKLVSLYTIVFFFILCIFGLSLYVYMYRSTYISIDEKLNEKAVAITAHSGKEIPEENEHETERRIAYLFWGQNRTLLRSYPNNVFLQKNLSKIYTREHDKKPQTVTIKGQYYRIVSIQTHDLKVNKKPIKLIQLLYNIDPEVNLLKTMLILIGFGCAAGLILSCLAGLFLANKALVPIQRSWEKQSRFVADASHELRTPLAVIQTHLELLFRHPSKTVEEESETIFKSLSEVKRINKLVEELLTLARSDSNEQQINPNYFMMNELIQLIVEQFKPIASMKKIHLKEATEKNLNYYGDKERIHQLFVILLDNALKFTAPEGVVSISCKKEGNLLKIIMKDTGVGIPTKDLPYIFDRFYRGDKSRTRSEGGTGLGLSIAKWIVEAHHGQISVESQHREGTAFIIKLPMNKSFN